MSEPFGGNRSIFDTREWAQIRKALAAWSESPKGSLRPADKGISGSKGRS